MGMGMGGRTYRLEAEDGMEDEEERKGKDGKGRETRADKSNVELA